MSDDEAKMRWDPYLLARDHEFDAFWSSHLASRSRQMLLVMGKGFDVRTIETAKRLHALGADFQIWQLAFDNGLDDSERRASLTKEHHQALLDLVGEDHVQSIPIQIGGPGGEIATSGNTKQALEAMGGYLDFDDIVVDISAMPRMVAMTAVAVLLYHTDNAPALVEKSRVNLHVTTAESVSADLGAARGSLSESVTLVKGFSGQLEAQTTNDWPRVWFPVLGEGQRERLTLIRDLVNPDEICPVIPFPTRSPRRGDEIVGEHRDILFDDFNVEPANILLACEYHPFEAYKQIFTAMDRYRRALRTLGGCKVFVSPLSSKLLSIGVLLACYDHRYGNVPGQRLDVGIPYVETAVYGDPDQSGGSEFELYSMWIRGEWEAVGAD